LVPDRLDSGFTVPGAAKRLGTSESSIRSAIYGGRLGARKQNGVLVIEEDELRRYASTKRPY
jgi:hypothetical protein